MASIVKHGEKWQARVTVNGKQEFKSFRLKSEAKAWAESRERMLRSMKGDTSVTLSDAIDRYRAISERKRGAQWERTRLDRFARDLGSLRLSELDSDDLAQWRTDRLESVQGATVRRELVLLNHVLETARKEWKWLAHNPLKDVSKPQDNQGRERRFTEEEIDALCVQLGYGLDTVSGRTASAFLFAIETACRCGELCGIRKQHIRGSVVRVSGKTGARDVPLSPRALEILEGFPDGFGLKPMQVSTAFRKAKNALGLDCTFHDSRREAVIRLSKIFDVLELSRITGHKNLSQLNTYYHADADALAQRFSPDPPDDESP